MLSQILYLLLAFLQYFRADSSTTFSSSFSHSPHACLPEQRAALLEFKSSISLGGCSMGYDYPKTNSWNESSDCCSWVGINCSEVTGHVIGINLTHSCLSGSLLANHIFFHLLGNLTQIISLDLSYNSFEGQIPDVFGDLKSITTLQFSSCNFSGQVPVTMFNLTQLRELDLSHNRLGGPLPNHVTQLQLLERFSISDNLINGRVPPWLFTLPSLKELDLSYNKLTGPIEQIHKPNFIQHIDMRSNNIHGPVPSFFYDLNLITLHLSSNNLSGVIESNMLSKLINLRQLDLSNNSLLSLSRSDNDFNYSFPNLRIVSFSYCSIRQFPSFFQTSSTLSVLDLSHNNISGGISKLDGEGWERLRILNLSYNFLTTLERFPGMNLEVLDLQSNLLQGPILSACLNPHIPSSPKFILFLMSNNRLTGNIPSLICNWSSLIILDLSANSLSGTIPGCLGNFSYFLLFMNLQMNKLSGKIPDSFTNNELRNLFLNNNQLEGSLPRSLAYCSSLEVLNLGNNRLTDTFPHWLASLPKLQVLILRSNRFHGSMPNSIASTNFSALRIIDLSRNELTGPLPANLFQNLGTMKDVLKEISSDWFVQVVDPEGYDYGFGYYPIYVNVTTKRSEMLLVKTLAIFSGMDFSNNRFCGKIPEELGELISLQVLNFSHNKFTGPIPSSLGNLVALESLDLSSNKLGDRIPSQLTDLTFLEVLDLSENDLVGPIPGGKQFNTFDNYSYRDNWGLCGFPLSKQCGNPDGPKPPASTTVRKGFAIPFIWKISMMGYGCGVVLGLSMGYIAFTTGRPWWFVRMIERDWQKKVSMWINRNGPRRN